MRARLVILILGVAAGLVAASGATAKDFRPGDLRICNHHRCIAIRKHSVVRLLGPFYYTGGTPPPAARAPRRGAPAFQLRFRNGYVTGIVATARLDRFLSYGVDLGRFAPGRWYRLPRRVARELRRLAAPVEPLRVTRRALARSR